MSEAKVTSPSPSPDALLNVLEGQLDDAKAQLTNTKSRVALWRAALYMMDHPDVYWDDVSDVIDVAMAQFANENDDVLRQDFQAYFGTHTVTEAQLKPQSDYRTFGQSPMALIEQKAKGLCADAQGAFQGPVRPMYYELRSMITMAMLGDEEGFKYHEINLERYVSQYAKQVPSYVPYINLAHDILNEVKTLISDESAQYI